MADYKGLSMTIHSRDEVTGEIVNTRIAVENPQDAFNVWEQADNDAHGFAMSWNGKTVYSRHNEEYGYQTWKYLDGVLQEHTKVYTDTVPFRVVKQPINPVVFDAWQLFAEMQNLTNRG